MTDTVVVIGQVVCDSSRGTIAIGEYVRLPVVEALQLQHANKVALGSWQDQQLADPLPRRLGRGRYRRADLRADA